MKLILQKNSFVTKIQEVISDFNYVISKEGTDEDKRDYFVSNEKIEKKVLKQSLNWKME